MSHQLPPQVCRDDEPRRRLGGIEPVWNGIDSIEVLRTDPGTPRLGGAPAGQTVLRVHLIRRLTPQFRNQTLPLESISIGGGRRITDVQVRLIHLRTPPPGAADDDYLDVTVEPTGDFSPYTLSLNQPWFPQSQFRPDFPDRFDPFYARAEFIFRPECPQSNDDADCPPANPPAPDPVIDYLARDYAGLRQLLFERLSFIIPDWKERHAPDIGVALVELLAYVGDRLSYYQDAVATEAYLGTARLRTSIRRHVRLIDYPMHDGCNARAWVWVNATDDKPAVGGAAPAPPPTPSDPADALPPHLALPSSVLFLSAPSTGPGFPRGQLVAADAWQAAAPGSFQAYELLATRGAPPWVLDQQYLQTSTNATDLLKPPTDWPAKPHENDRVRVFPAHSTIDFYTWGNQQCRLPCGATRAALRGCLWAPPRKQTPDRCDPIDQDPDAPVLYLHPGDFLLLEEIIGPVTGQAADADPTRKHVVMLTHVAPGFDPIGEWDAKANALVPRHYVEIEWDIRDALPFTLCLSAVTPYKNNEAAATGDSCKDQPPCPHQATAVARGNVFLVDHGMTLRNRPIDPPPPTFTEDLGQVAIRCPRLAEPCLGEDRPAPIVKVARPFRPTLRNAPLTRRQELPPPDQHPAAAGLLVQNPREALPQIAVWPVQDGPSPLWLPRRDLLASGPQDRHFIAEAENDGLTSLRFGDGVNGRLPDLETLFRARYRVGNGVAGNVGADTIVHVALPAGVTLDSGYRLEVRNPFPARGGTEPEPLEDVRRLAPDAFTTELLRVVIPNDYNRIVARRFPEVQRASAVVRSVGGRDTVFVIVDFLGRVPTQRRGEILARIAAFLDCYRQIGQRVQTREATSVPLDVELRIELQPSALRRPIVAALGDLFGNRIRPDGQRGFFHPDNLTFGQGIARSRLIAVAQSVKGVASVEVTRLGRLEQPSGRVPQFLSIGPLEVARLDNDPNRLEAGRLRLDVRGGR